MEIKIYDTVIYNRNGIVICPKTGHLLPLVKGSMGMVTQISITAFGNLYSVVFGELLLNMVMQDDIMLAPEQKKDHICNMVTFFNENDMVSFGQYLLSEKRADRIKSAVSEVENPEYVNSLYEDLKGMVHHADIENWLEENKKCNAMG